MKLTNKKNKVKQPRLFGTKSTFSTLGVKALRDEEEDEVVMGEEFCGYFVENKSITRLVVPIDTIFKDPYHYRMVVNKMDELGPEDTVEFWINSDGGDLSGLVALLTAAKVTEAHTLAIVQGSCHSSASLLALSCDSIEVRPYATMLCHNVRFGAVGKGADVLAQVQHTNEFAASILREAYDLFLTEEEIEAVLKGLELYLNYAQITERLEAKYKILGEDTDETEGEAVLPAVYSVLKGCCGDPDTCDSICECPYAMDAEDDDSEYTED
jgi:ATP-dependent protease ClpP protease subunit